MITPRTVIDAILEGAKHTEPTTKKFYSYSTETACARGAGYVGYLRLNRKRLARVKSVQMLVPDEYLNAERNLRDAYFGKYGTTIEDDNDNNLGRELTIQRIKDLYPKVD